MISTMIAKKTTILHISDEVMVIILTYLRAVDLAVCSQVNQTIFTKERISDAASFLLWSVFDKTSPATSKRNALIPRIDVLPVVLYVNEMSSVLSVISSRPHLKTQLNCENNQFYWISTSWLATVRKFCESVAALELDSKKRISKTKQRKLAGSKRNSNALVPPSTNINVDITCAHSSLLPVKEGRKKMVDAGTWHYLHQLYGEGCTFPSTQSDCPVCVQEAKDRQLLRSAEKGTSSGSSSGSEYLSHVQILERGLTSLALRRSGIPTSSRATNSNSSSNINSSDAYYLTEEDFEDEQDLLAWTLADAAVLEEQEEAQSPSTGGQPAEHHPLRPGSYNVVPREWLRVWRRYLKDPFSVVSGGSSGSSSSNSNTPNACSSPYAAKYGLPPLDCTSLLCHNHGLLVIPLHLEEYLVGLRRNLLNGLGKYRGEVVEVVTEEEWELLQTSLNSLSDFSVRFTIDEEYSVTWNIPVCERCDKVNYSL